MSITLNTGGKLLRWLWGAVTQWSGHMQLKQEALGLILVATRTVVCLFFLFQLAY